MRAHKHVEDLVELNRVGIVGHPHAFGMAGLAAADLFVGRIGDIAADIAAFDLVDADDVLHHRFGAPEAPTCDDYLFLCHFVSPLPGDVGTRHALVIRSLRGQSMSQDISRETDDA